MAAAFRSVLNRTKQWAWGLRHRQHFEGEFGFIGAVRRDEPVFGPNLLSNSRCLSSGVVYHQFRSRGRDEGLSPPPMPVEYDCGPEYLWRVKSVSNHKEALAAAEFAVTKHNDTEGRNIRFERVVRASRMAVVAGYDYYLTLEGIDENGDLHVYYAEVCDCPAETLKQLRKWQLVDESFSYPFQLMSDGELDEEEWFDGSWPILRMFLPTVTLKYEDGTDHRTFDILGRKSDRGQCVGNPDPPRKTMNSEKNVLHMTDSSSGISRNDDIDSLHSHTATSPDVVPVYNMIHCGRVVYYAYSAVKMFKEKGKDVYLSKVLHASKEHVDGKVFYNLLLKAENDEEEFSFLYASLEVSELKEELIKWHSVLELSSGPLGNEQIEEDDF